jgi:hypothetical protein
MWDEIYFPFDPALQNEDLKRLRVEHSTAAAKQRIEELYQCDTGGAISVTISNMTSGFSRTYKLGRWSTETKPVKASGRKKKQLGVGTSG